MHNVISKFSSDGRADMKSNLHFFNELFKTSKQE